METIITEALPLWQPPSGDTRLVLFNDEAVHQTRPDANRVLIRCSEYAAKYGVWVVSGLVVHQENLCLALFGPDGKAACRQPALHLAMPMRGALRPADTAQVVHTGLGNLFLCADADLLHPEVMRAAALKGADVVLSVQHLDPVDDTPQRLMCTVWNAAQSNNLYVVNISCGCCTVACPAPLTRGRDGWLLRRTGALPARFGLNLERLDEVRGSFQLMERINTALVRRYAAELGR